MMDRGSIGKHLCNISIFLYSCLGFKTQNLHGILTSIPNSGEGDNRWRDVCIPEQLEGTRHQMLCFYFYVFARSFGGMVARAGQRAKAKYLGFVGTTAGRNKPGSRSTSLKTQQESSRAFLALHPLSPSLHSSLLSVTTDIIHAFPHQAG